MKLLFDQNLSFKLCSRLSDLFPGSSQVRLVGLAEADDWTVWEHAKAGGFTIVSQDSEFCGTGGAAWAAAKDRMAAWRKSTDQHY